MSSEKRKIQEFADSFQRGEEKGFSYFFKSLYPALLYYSFTILNDKVVAEDIVEEAFIKIWDRHDNFNHSGVIKSWLYTTVRNASLDYLRRQKQTKKNEEGFTLYAKNNVEANALQTIISVEVAAEVYRSIKLLPPQCQRVIKLLYVQGKSLQEAAEELKLSVNTVKNQRARGIKLIRERGSFLVSLMSLLLFVFIS